MKYMLPVKYCNLMMFQPCFLKNACSASIKLRNFNTGMYHLCDLPSSKDSDLLFTGVEHIETLKSVSKKHIKLSKVEEKDISVVNELKKRNDLYPYKSPEEKAKKVLIEDGKIALRKAFNVLTNVKLGKLEHEYFPRETDVLIIGGGAAGLLIAHALRAQFPKGPTITVVDKFKCIPHPTINLGQGFVTQQLFTDEEEISALKYGAEFFSSFKRTTRVDEKPEFKLTYDPMGSLILADAKNAEQVLKNIDTLKVHGIKTKILSRAKLKEKFPWLNIDGVVFGSLGMYNEGIIDPWTFLYGIKCKSVNLGVTFLQAEVIDFGYENGVLVRAVCRLPDGTYNSIDFGYCVIAGGIESLNLVGLFNESGQFNLKLNLPLEERMRYEYCFYSPNGPGLNTPVVVEPDGTYFRREGLTGHFIAGVPSIVSDQDTPYHVFQSQIKPFLMKRMSQINKFELVKGWIDVYDFCYSNKIGIVGPHPETTRIIFALGFSHFGLLLLPALARAVMECITYDEYQTLDFTKFHIENLWRKQHLEADRKRRELLEAEKRIPLTDPETEKNELRTAS